MNRKQALQRLAKAIIKVTGDNNDWCIHGPPDGWDSWTLGGESWPWGWATTIGSGATILAELNNTWGTPAEEAIQKVIDDCGRHNIHFEAVNSVEICAYKD